MNRLRAVLGTAALALLIIKGHTAEASPWTADNGDGTYKNPVLHADYSDPDVIRVGADFYMVASSFDALPGLPLLHSRDLVNWQLLAHVFQVQPPRDVYSKAQHGNGAWAPSLRVHGGEFFVFYPDPELGIYMTKARDPAGPWSEPLLIKQARGWIDPCPLWDDDGTAYLVSAMAASRSGVASTLLVSRLSPDGTKLLDEGAVVFDGHARDPTVEGPKFYKRNGYYYIFAPAGGVPQGWQLALRSRTVYGPYERKVVLAQGDTAINGPHQGAWVDTPSGESWFIHFQDKAAYGRVVHLQPMRWVDDWPVIGDHGQPVLTYRKPDVRKALPLETPADSDEFNAPSLGLQWQWQANAQPGWAFPAPAYGALRLYAIAPPAGHHNLWDVPNLLLQKFPAPQFSVTTKITLAALADEDQAGLLIMGTDYAYLSIRRRGDGLYVSQVICKGADQGAAESESTPIRVAGDTIHLRVSVGRSADARFAYSADGSDFNEVGGTFTARPGRWIGAKVGLFALGVAHAGELGYADVDWFRVQ